MAISDLVHFWKNKQCDGQNYTDWLRANRMLPLLGIHVAAEYYRCDHKPPVTSALLAANSLVFLRPAFLEPILPSIRQVCFNPHLIIKNKDMKRFFLSPLYNNGEFHLLYNMLSLLSKGIQLESSMDSVEYASMVAMLLGLSQGITLVFSKALLVLFDNEKTYYSQYAVGFSGVLFAMKVVLNAQSEDISYVGFIPVPTRYAIWAELALTQMTVPDVSFIGHLGGILAGFLYLRLRDVCSGSDPLILVIRGVIGVLKWPLRTARRLFPFLWRQVSGRGPVGRSRTGIAAADWICNACTYENLGYLDVCEMCETDRNDSGNGNTMAVGHTEHYSGDLLWKNYGCEGWKDLVNDGS